MITCIDTVLHVSKSPVIGRIHIPSCCLVHIDSFVKYAPMARDVSMLDIITTVVEHNLHYKQTDVKVAFLNVHIVCEVLILLPCWIYSPSWTPICEDVEVGTWVETGCSRLVAAAAQSKDGICSGVWYFLRPIRVHTHGNRRASRFCVVSWQWPGWWLCCGITWLAFRYWFVSRTQGWHCDNLYLVWFTNYVWYVRLGGFGGTSLGCLPDYEHFRDRSPWCISPIHQIRHISRSLCITTKYWYHMMHLIAHAAIGNIATMDM